MIQVAKKDYLKHLFRTLRQCGFSTLNTLEQRRNNCTIPEQAVWYFKCAVLLQGDVPTMLSETDYEEFKKYFRDGYNPTISLSSLEEHFGNKKAEWISSYLPLAYELCSEIEGMTDEAKRLGLSFTKSEGKLLKMSGENK